MDEIAENCNRAAVFAEGKVLLCAEPKTLFSNAELLLSRGLDLPFTAKLTRALSAQGVEIDSDFTVADFIQKTLAFAQTKGAGMRLTDKGGECHA
jgi:hypothetical protein